MTTIDLSDIGGSSEGGVWNLSGLKYQFHFAASKCLSLIQNPNLIEYVACELIDDVTLKYCNGEYEFFQVKQKSDGLWTFNELKELRVWQHFWEIQEKLGNICSFRFVSDQSYQQRVSKKPDLGKMQKLTEFGKCFCNDLELIDADEIIKRLMDTINVSEKDKVECFFWKIRMIKDEQKNGLICQNLLKLEKILTDRGIATDINNRLQIYGSLLSLIENQIDITTPEETRKEKREQRKITGDMVWDVLSKGPFRSSKSNSFSTENSDELDKDLRRKCEDVSFPEKFILYFLDSRNHFSYQFRQDIMFSTKLDYLTRLRMKILDLCIASSLSQFKNGNTNSVISYSEIFDNLGKLADEEAKTNPPVQVDKAYLHGMFCQLTAECHNDFYPIK